MKQQREPVRSDERKPVARRRASAGGMSRRRRWIMAAVLLLLGAVAVTMGFGGSLLEAPDPLPERADAAVVLAGSDEANIARFDAAMRLLEEGRVDQVFMRVPPLTVWGVWQPDVVRRFIAREYDETLGARVVICEGLADSTLEEANMMQPCLQSRGLRSVIVVTSNYHTRRSKWIWKATLARTPPRVSVTVYGVFDGSFEADDWWRHRRYAKTWLVETSKIAWYMIESVAPWS